MAAISLGLFFIAFFISTIDSFSFFSSILNSSLFIGNFMYGFDTLGQSNFGKYIVFLGSVVFVNDKVYPDLP